ncbi:flagellin [Thalassospira lucentensis]|uniref:flagellin N-terminal helical domain-containing protein n=1 Tax=Thalassospira lucentensis TaxID=168935 RepID=UPI00399D5D04
MALNIISNYAANVAHRNLQNSDEMATRSLAKLSSGTRVVSARDDAASMAIGARLNATTQALKTATVNVGQANSMLQIADGSMATIDDVLVRMKTLATQAASGNLSDTERGFLDDEFQLLNDEIGRVSSSTNFNGIQLLGDGGDVDIDFTTVGAAGGAALTNANGFSSFAITDNNFWAQDTTGDASGTPSLTDNNFSIDITSGPAGSAIMTVTATVDDVNGGGTTSYTQSIDITSYQTGGANVVGVGESASLNFDEIGLSFSLNNGITTLVDAAVGGTDFGNANADAATVSMLADNGQSFTADIDFQIGSNNTASDRLSITLQEVDQTTLGINNSSIGTQADAQAAIESVNSAIDTLQEARANVGTYQNRLDFAGQNLATTQENNESARSTLMDLDVAAEMTQFTSKQILVQSGVAMLAQANQMPQNLLRLLQ